MLQNVTLLGQGTAGNSIAVDTLVAAISGLTVGRYRVWGRGRHSLADGLKLTSPTVLTFPSSPNDAFDFGPFIFDIASSGIGICVSLAVATGASDTARVILYAEKINGV